VSPPPGAPVGGVVPVAPTIFHPDGSLDLEGQRRTLDFLVDAGSDAICVLANWSEQFALSDVERERLTDLALEQVNGRLPVVVTTSHFSTRVAAERSRRAEAAGASLVMLMAPYHGATIRAGEAAIRAYFAGVADGLNIPVVVQDAPMSGAVLSAELLADLAHAIPNVRYVKLEQSDAADKLRALLRLAGDVIDGPWDGEESITLIADLDAGATGTMPGGVIPEILGEVVRRHRGGDRAAAVELYERWLPLINWENKHGGLQTTKALLMEGGIIASDAVRAPLAPMSHELRAGLVDLARRLAPLILGWAE